MFGGVKGIKEWKKPFLPKIVVIDPDIWLTKPTETDNGDLKWFLNQTCDTLAFYHSNTIYVRDDAFTIRIILHEMGHWIIHKWLHNAWKLQDWWDHHSPFAYHMVRVAIKVGMISRKEIYEICKEKKSAEVGGESTEYELITQKCPTVGVKNSK